MASSISLEYLQSIEGQAGGLATLDSGGTIPLSQIPDSIESPFKGTYATPAALTAAHDTGNLADYAYVTSTSSFWYWNSALATPAWVNRQITATEYLALTVAQRAPVPYIIIPTP